MTKSKLIDVKDVPEGKTKKHSKPKLIHNPFTEQQLAQMKELVTTGIFDSRSEIIREAVDRFLERYVFLEAE